MPGMVIAVHFMWLKVDTCSQDLIHVATGNQVAMNRSAMICNIEHMGPCTTLGAPPTALACKTAGQQCLDNFHLALSKK